MTTPHTSSPGSAADLARRAASLLLLGCLGACTVGEGSAQAESDAAATDRALSDARVPSAPPAVRSDEGEAEAHGDALAEQIALRLQACAYDGSTITVNGESLSPPSDGACVDLVNRIMRFTGLPQNFNVVEAPVPNAAALILVDDSKTPRRVIAFNRSFLGMVGRATGDNPWAPISIMAHEIGHHLSGHTILPGGSQPPIELEADKFSGFVLYRMGASLSDAQHAMSALVPADVRSRTHPGRAARLDAIAQGWREACEQHAGSACDAGMAQTAASTSSAARITDVPPQHDAPPAVAAPAVAAAPPAPGGTPSKFGRFVYDEYGLLDADIVAAVERRLFRHVEEHQVEIVTVLTRDTRGLSANEYAEAMLRQLRVGKLDVGNGTVLVVAPERGETAIAMGPGVALQMQGVIESDLQRLQSFLQISWPYCVKRGACGSGTELLLEAATHIADDTRLVDWRIRHFGLDDMLAAADTHLRTRDPAAPVDVANDPTWQKLLQTEVEVLDTALPAEGEGYFTSPGKGTPVLLRTVDGRRLIAQAPSSLAGLMPSGPLRQGQRYSMVMRASSLDMPTPLFDLLSYVEVDR
jgi:hypothetical protein